MQRSVSFSPDLFRIFVKRASETRSKIKVIKDKVLAIRIPEVVHSRLAELAREKGVTLTDLVREALSGLTWEIELQRNIEYHKSVIQQLKEIEKTMRSTQRERSKAMTGTEVRARRKEQLELV